MALGQAQQRRRVMRHTVGISILVLMTLAGCANEQALVAADHARCRELGFQPMTREYDVCLSGMKGRRTTQLEQLRE
jgi:hypothetical protein